MLGEADSASAGDTQRMAELTQMVIQQIRQLSELHEEGILTDEEFAAKKQELLSRL